MNQILKLFENFEDFLFVPPILRFNENHGHAYKVWLDSIKEFPTDEFKVSLDKNPRSISSVEQRSLNHNFVGFHGFQPCAINQWYKKPP